MPLQELNSVTGKSAILSIKICACAFIFLWIAFNLAYVTETDNHQMLLLAGNFQGLSAKALHTG